MTDQGGTLLPSDATGTTDGIALLDRASDDRIRVLDDEGRAIEAKAEEEIATAIEAAEAELIGPDDAFANVYATPTDRVREGRDRLRARDDRYGDEKLTRYDDWN